MKPGEVECTDSDDETDAEVDTLQQWKASGVALANASQLSPLKAGQVTAGGKPTRDEQLGIPHHHHLIDIVAPDHQFDTATGKSIRYWQDAHRRETPRYAVQWIGLRCERPHLSAGQHSVERHCHAHHIRHDAIRQTPDDLPARD